MKIETIDKNFDTTFHAPEDIEWFSVQSGPFTVYGIAYSEEEGLYRRLPKDVAETVSEAVTHLSKHTSGGRVRFCTNSPYIAVRIEEPFEPPFAHMAIAGKCGVALFADGAFAGGIRPTYKQMVNADPACGGNGTLIFDGISYPYGVTESYQVEIFLPLYSSVRKIFVGLKKGAVLRAARMYKHATPVLFYGSSITQGGCASKPGDDYVNRLSRMLDTDVWNLGFSGSAKAEEGIAKYIAKQKPSVFVLDYDHNAPTLEHLQQTHFSLYETVRKENPQTPIIMMTMPTIEGHQGRPWNQARREVIVKTIETAKANGDENIYLVDCYGCFGEKINGECGTIDDCHPDSLGFLRIAERLCPILNKLLNEKE